MTNVRECLSKAAEFESRAAIATDGQATSVGALPPVTSLHEQIKALIRRSRVVEDVTAPSTFGIVPT
jgi:hypothetical protein